MSSEENSENGKQDANLDEESGTNPNGELCIIMTIVGEYYGRVPVFQADEQKLSVYKPIQIKMAHVQGGVQPVARSIVHDSKMNRDTVQMNRNCVLFVEPIGEDALAYDEMVGDKDPERGSGILVATQAPPEGLKLPPGVNMGG